MTKIIVILFIVFCIESTGQMNNSYIHQTGNSNLVNINQVGFENISYVLQRGDNNANEAIQEGTGNYFFYYDQGQSYSMNQSIGKEELSAVYFNNYNNLNSIFQSGRLNGAIITNVGNNVEIDVTQLGDFNRYTNRNNGEHNQYEVAQIGNQNYVFQDIKVSNHEFTITQQGNFNRVIHRDNSYSGFDISISQVGNSMNAIIINGSIYK